MDYFLRNLIHENYWRRGWIVQEVVLATGKLLVRFGNHSAPWPVFLLWVQGYRQRNPTDHKAELIIHLDQLRQSRSRLGAVLTLAGLLDASKDSFTSHHKNGIFPDKIYALLNLAHDCPTGSFPVDYTKSASQIYQDCVVYLWKHSSMTSLQRRIELAYFASLVRRLLTRKPALRSKEKRPFGEHPYEAMYLVYSRPRELQGVTLGTMLSSIIESISFRLFMAAVDKIVKIGWSNLSHQEQTSKEWFWHASEPEDLNMWTMNRNEAEDLHDMVLHGSIFDEVKHVIPLHCNWSSTYGSSSTSIPFQYFFLEDPWSADEHSLESEIGQFLLTCRWKPNHHALQYLRSTQPFWLGRTTGDTQSPYHQSTAQPFSIFIGRSGYMGLAPSHAQPGDTLCKLWNSTALAIVRKDTPSTQSDQQTLPLHPQYTLIGRAFPNPTHPLPNHDPAWFTLNAQLFAVPNDRTLDFPVSLHQLTYLTLDALFWDQT